MLVLPVTSIDPPSIVIAEFPSGIFPDVMVKLLLTVIDEFSDV